MRRVLAFVICFLLACSVGLGSASHAIEPVATCIEASAASNLDHAVGDVDQVPADTEKSYPHHHGGCHGHDVGVPIASDSVQPSASRGAPPFAWDHDRTAGATADPALRPPQA